MAENSIEKVAMSDGLHFRQPNNQRPFKKLDIFEKNCQAGGCNKIKKKIITTTITTPAQKTILGSDFNIINNLPFIKDAPVKITGSGNILIN